MNDKVDESIGYYGRVTHALVLADHGSCGVAIPELQKLLDENPTDEVVFPSLITCLSDQEQNNKIPAILEALRQKGVFPGKFIRALSFNNVGFGLMLISPGNLENAAEAYRYLRRGEQIATIDEPAQLSPVLFNLLVYELVYGDSDKARAYADRLKARDRTEWEPWVAGWSEGYGKNVIAIKLGAADRLKQLLAP